MKKTICCLLVLLLGTSALLCGCGKGGENTVAITDCEMLVQVTSVSGKEISFTVTNGMPGGDMRGGDMTPPEGEIPGEDFGGEIPELPQRDSDGFPGEMSGIPEQMPSGNNRTGAASGIITVGDTDVLYKSQNGTEISAGLSDISSGTTLRVTFDHAGNVTKILIAEETFGMPEEPGR